MTIENSGHITQWNRAEICELLESKQMELLVPDLARIMFNESVRNYIQVATQRAILGQSWIFYAGPYPFLFNHRGYTYSVDLIPSALAGTFIDGTTISKQTTKPMLPGSWHGQVTWTGLLVMIPQDEKNIFKRLINYIYYCIIFRRFVPWRRSAIDRKWMSTTFKAIRAAVWGMKDEIVEAIYKNINREDNRE